MAERITNIGESIEYIDDTNYMRATNVAIVVEYVETEEEAGPTFGPEAQIF